MKILICSDGTPAAESAIELGGLLASRLKAETTLFGIAEKSQDERLLREALEKQAQPLRSQNVALDIIVHAGEPIREILDRTSKTSYDLVIIGARWTGATGYYLRSKKRARTPWRLRRSAASARHRDRPSIRRSARR